MKNKYSSEKEVQFACLDVGVAYVVVLVFVIVVFIAVVVVSCCCFVILLGTGGFGRRRDHMCRTARRDKALRD